MTDERKWPKCECLVYYSDHHPECPVRRKFDAQSAEMKARDERIAELEAERDTLIAAVGVHLTARSDYYGLIQSLQSRLGEFQKRPAVELRYVLYVPQCKCVFGPFSSEDHAKVWALSGIGGGLDYEVIEYKDLLDDALKSRVAARAVEDQRPCTCHPDDNPPVPCQRKFALAECRAAEATSKDLLQVRAVEKQ